MEGDGTVKSVRRAAALIKLLAREATAGWRLSDIAQASGLGKATTHRLLTALTETGLAYQDPKTRRYLLGYELVRLGYLATRFDIAQLARPTLLRLARETGDTVFLSVREGLDALCLERQVGDFPIKTLTLDVGDRRPLGVGAGSLALLAFLPEEEIAELIAGNAARLAAFPGFAPDALRSLVAEARSRGFSFNDGRIVSAMCALGVPVRDPRGAVVAAISVAAIRERMDEARVLRVAALLRREASGLRERLVELSEGAPRPGAEVD